MERKAISSNAIAMGSRGMSQGVYLWYPGNSIVLKGHWKRQGTGICFEHGANTYNPVTGVQGVNWECISFRIYWGGIGERMKGDIFALRGRSGVPFVLSKDRTTLEALLSRASPRTRALNPHQYPHGPDCGKLRLDHNHRRPQRGNFERRWDKVPPVPTKPAVGLQKRQDRQPIARPGRNGRQRPTNWPRPSR